MNGTHYTVNGVQYPRVTAIVGLLRSVGLERWRGKVGNDEADRMSRESTMFGTAVHAACEQIALGQLLDCEPSVEPFALAFQDWLERDVRSVLSVERLLVSETLGYAGTCDLLAEMRDGALGVIDLKTSASAGCEYRLQLAAYWQATLGLTEFCRYQRARRLVVRMPKAERGVLYVHEYGEHEADAEAFLSLLEVYRWHERRKDDWRVPGQQLVRDCGSLDVERRVVPS